MVVHQTHEEVAMHEAVAVHEATDARRRQWRGLAGCAGGFAATVAALVLAFCALASGVVASCVLASSARAAARAVVLDINGAIGPAVADYVVRGIRSARDADAGVIVLRMNTPGGLDSSMREIIAAILVSPVPVIAYVAPDGARAASAGTYIAYASSIAAMAPGTNMGAATPIELGGPSFLPGGSPQRPDQRTPHRDNAKGDNSSTDNSKGDDAGRNGGRDDETADTHTRKMVNDAAAYIHGLAELNGRNAEWADEAVRRAASIAAPEALQLHVVDVIAGSVDDLLREVDGRSVRAGGRTVTLMTAGLDVESVPPDWRTQFLGVITDPNVAFLLMLLGVYGLLFEFLSPGAVAPGVIGGLSLLLALYALDLLPVNYAGAALVVFGMVLMAIEAHIGSLGLIGIAGAVAFVAGAIMMFPVTSLSPPVIATAAAMSVLFFLFGTAALLRARRRRVVTGAEALAGAAGEVVSWHEHRPGGRVRVLGEVWRARSPVPLAPGTTVTVTGREGLTLVVTPVNPARVEEFQQEGIVR
jgi:membrane-bound serine protease (ClpP class)